MTPDLDSVTVDPAPPPVPPPGPAPANRRPLLVGIVVVLALGVVIALGSGLLGGSPALTNPVPATADSVARGSAVYSSSCAKCHGVDARGGGPDAGTTAVPPPALSGPSAHLTVHADGDLFTFIHDGLPGGMPSWGGTLTDNQTWDVINFLRSLSGS